MIHSKGSEPNLFFSTQSLPFSDLFFLSVAKIKPYAQIHSVHNSHDNSHHRFLCNHYDHHYNADQSPYYSSSCGPQMEHCVIYPLSIISLHKAK